MKLMTRQAEASSAAERWKHSFGDGWPRAKYWENTREVYDRLVALGPSPSPEDVNAAIRNESWSNDWIAMLTCDECKRDVESFVQLGEESDRDSNTAWICKDCLKRASELIT